MTETKIVLTPQGLKESELHLIKTICVLSEGRGRAYSFMCTEEPHRRPVVWLVDAAVEPEWRATHGPAALAVFITAAGTAAAAGRHEVRRPITPSRLLAALDAIAEQELGLLSHLVIGGAGSAEAVPASSTPKAGSHSQHLALVVDDSTTIQKQIEVSLRALGIAAVCVDNSEAAIKALDDGTFDIIFLDVVLPGNADGYQICKTVRRHNAHRRTPVVMLTSKSSTFDRVRGSMAGCDTYLTKPVDAETFREVVEKYLPHAMEGVPRPQYT